jgi:hypothetical protein
MTINIDADARLARGRSIIFDTASPMPWLVMAALFLLAVVVRHVVAANTDVSWLLIAGERLLDGQRLYLDIIETNPPMAVLIYVPGILIGRALGLPAEMVVDGLVLTAVAVAVALVGRILQKSSVLENGQGWPLAWLAVAVLTIMPAQAFAQREHIAVVELLPALALVAMRMKQEHPPRWAVGIAGLGLGLSLSFKPYFAIAVLCCVGVLAVRRKSWRMIFAPEFWIAAAVVGIYVAFIKLSFPAYFTVIGPLARDVYVPIGITMLELLQRPIVLVWALVLLAAMLRMRRRAADPSFLMLLSLSIGFAIVFFVQRKGWPYHAFPMTVFAVLAFGYAITLPGHREGAHRPMAIAAVMALAALFYQAMLCFNMAFDARPLQAVVARYGQHPKILAVSGEAGIGHPLTRALGGTWVSREQNIWVAAYGRYLDQHGAPDAATLATLERHAATERQWLIEDIRRIPPTVVLIDNLTDDWGGWLRSHPDIADLLKDYRLAETFDRVDVLIRRAD